MSKMRQRIKRTTKIFVVLYIVCFVYFFYGLFASVDFYFWHSVGKPPEDILKIIDVNDELVLVQTNSQNYYSCNISKFENCWELKDYQPDKTLGFPCFYDPPQGESIQTESSCDTIFHTYGEVQTIYQLSSDGNIYVKQKVVITIVGYLLIAFFAGVLTVIILMLMNPNPKELIITVPEDYLQKK